MRGPDDGLLRHFGIVGVGLWKLSESLRRFDDQEYFALAREAQVVEIAAGGGVKTLRLTEVAARAQDDLFVLIGPQVERLQTDVRFRFRELLFTADHAPLGLDDALQHSRIKVVLGAIFSEPAGVELVVVFFALAGQDAVLH